MKNRDIVLLLIVVAVGLFIWQLLQKVNTGLATVSQNDKTGSDRLSEAVDKISVSTADLRSQLDAIPPAPEPVTPFDYVSSYQSVLQSNPAD